MSKGGPAPKLQIVLFPNVIPVFLGQLCVIDSGVPFFDKLDHLLKEAAGNLHFEKFDIHTSHVKCHPSARGISKFGKSSFIVVKKLFPNSRPSNNQMSQVTSVQVTKYFFFRGCKKQLYITYDVIFYEDVPTIESMY